MGIRLEEIPGNGKYYKKDTEFGENNNEEVIWSISGRKVEEEKVYTYDEAIDLTGNGWYNTGLLMTLTLSVLAMALDMFGFTYVVTAAACDWGLSHNQTTFLLSMPLLGPITSACLHGYISDTCGRKKCLSIVLWASFIIASLSAMSPNFIVLAILKFFSTSICSGIQSLAFTLLGESCSVRTKGSYMLILTNFLVCGFAVYTSHAYLVLGLDFTYDLGFITFKPWRLLILTLSINLGLSAFFVSFFYESPKFLVNAKRIEEALDILRKIKRRNRDHNDYPVKKIILLEESSSPRRDVSLLTSLWDQTVPLFKPPLLQRTALLFYITAIIYCVNSGFFLWISVLTRAFFEEVTVTKENITDGFCSMLNSTQSHGKINDCTSEVSLQTLLMSIIQGMTFLIINFGLAVIANKQKAVTIFTFVLSSFSCFAMIFVTEKFLTIVLFLAMLTNCFIMGIVFCYYVELYPTCYRGMISCLGVMVARLSGMAGVHLVGAYTFTHCTTSLYIWGAYIFSGALTALLLPPDTPKKL